MYFFLGNKNAIRESDEKVRDAGFSWKRSGNAGSGPPFQTLYQQGQKLVVIYEHSLPRNDVPSHSSETGTELRGENPWVKCTASQSLIR